MLAVSARLMEIKRIVDAGKSPMEEKSLECRHCDRKLSLEEVHYPVGRNGFLCPKCNRLLQPVPIPCVSETAGNSTVRDDLGYFFSLLKEADKACAAGCLDKISR